MAAAGRERRASLDLIIPIYNEEDSLPALVRRLEGVFSSSNLSRAGLGNMRYLLIDDGSVDRSPELIRDYIEKGFPAVLYRFSRNFGHQSAVSAGIDHADADLVGVMDADLQDPPEVVLEMVARWREGFDVVYGQRRRRKEIFFKRAGYWLFYRLLAFLSETKVPLDAGDFCLMDRRVVEQIRRLPERLRFLRGLRSWVGFRQCAVIHDRPARQRGETKYTLAKLYRLATDGIASMSTRPLKALQLLSFVFFLLSALLMGLLFLKRWVLPPWAQVSDQFLGLYLLIAVSAAMQTLAVYIMGAYVGRTYLEVKGRPTYIVMEVVQKDVSAGPSGPAAP